MCLVYQDQMIQLKRYDMVQYPQVQNSAAQSPEIRLLEVITPEANRSNKGQSTIKQTKADNQHPLNHTQSQVLRIVIECIKGSRF